MRPCLVALTTLALAIARPACADSRTPPAPVLELDTRVRAEQVDDERFAHEARAQTIRLHAKARSPRWAGFGAVLGVAAVRHFGDGTFNDTIHRAPSYPTIADPDSERVEEAYVDYGAPLTPFGDDIEAGLWAGRRALSYDNQRFISGGAAWRQNWQSVEGVGATLHWGPRLEGSIAHVTRIERPTSNRSARGRQRLAGEFVHLALPLDERVQFVAFGYWFDLDDSPVLSAADSHRDLGVSFTGTWPLTARARVGYLAVIAWQRPYADGRASNRSEYADLRASAALGDVKLEVEREHLGGNGVYGFQTPFAALHAFNGHADRFLQTPKDGLNDMAVTLSWNRGRWAAWASGHQFNADERGYRYGRELDAGVSYRLVRGGTLSVKHADYRSANSPTLLERSPAQFRDSRKLWLQWEYAFRLSGHAG